ncbi:MAG TPA: OsmC family protein [Terriglobia bacterium]|nr:OsmC family protein [Terriglobia bacterium]
MIEPKDFSFASTDREAGATYTWTSRVRPNLKNGATTAYARSQTFAVGEQVSFKGEDEHPCAVEYLLGSLGADLIFGFRKEASRRGVAVSELEASISGRLGNPLVVLGVIGESGYPGFEIIDGVLYVGADAEEAVLSDIWRETLARSPLASTLGRATKLSLELNVVL